MVIDEASLADQPGGEVRTSRRIRLEWRSRIGWPLGVVAAVVLANLLPLLGIVDVNPLGSVAGIARFKVGYLPGQGFTDLYTGYTSQALGHLAAVDWLHGTIPWWNPFEGLGVPLLAEMQSAAFFPPTLLLALFQGQLYFHMTLEATAGLATWFLLRELGFGRSVATLGGILFALNGTFAWLTANSENPVAFLPLMILGIERLYRRDKFDTAGFLILAGGLALSIYAGAPETTYFEALFAFVWCIFRLAGNPSSGRRRFAGFVILGGVVGLLIAAPLVVAFVSYLHIAYLGPNLGGYTKVHLPLPDIATIGLPYLFGPIKAFQPTYLTRATWVDAGGFVTAPVLALSFAGLTGGGRERGMRWLLAGTALVLLLWSFGVPVVQRVLERILPGIRDVEFFRYASPVWELAFVLLACFGVEAFARRKVRWRALMIAGSGVFALGMVAWDFVLARPTIAVLDRSAAYHIYPVLMLSWAVGAVLAVTAAGFIGGRGAPAHRVQRATSARSGWGRAAAGIVGALLAIDTILMFALPELSSPRSVTIDTGPAEYLAAHLGYGRFFSIDVYNPNYGSYFGLASADVNDVPQPKLWTAYVPTYLAPGTKPGFIFGRQYGASTVTAIADHLVDRLAAYEAIDVRYVVVASNLFLFGHAPLLADGVTEVYHDPQMTIYLLPHPKPFFSTTGAPCRIAPANRDLAVVKCAGRATLMRAELELPGWSATIDGHAVPIAAVDGGLTSVRLPPGTSHVSFSYFPPHEGLAIWGFVVGVLCAIGVPLFASHRRRRRGAADQRGRTVPAPESRDSPRVPTSAEDATSRGATSRKA